MELDITLCMVVRDEEDCLDRCLASAVPWISECIVLDTGSQDRTMEIAQNFGCRCHSVRWEHDFAAVRNAALDLASRSWILVLDADEEIEPGQWELLQSLTRADDVDGYYVRIKSFVGTVESGEFFVDSVCRLFRNDPRIRFQGRIHEDVITSLRELRTDNVAFSEFQVAHYGYLEEVIQRKKKGERNRLLLQHAMEEQPEELIWRYAWGTELFAQGAYERALQEFEPLLPRVEVYGGYASDLLLKTVYAMRAVGRHEDARNWVQQGLTFYPDFADLHEVNGLLLLDQGRPREAIVAFDQSATEQGKKSSAAYTLTSGTGGYRTDYWKGNALERLLRWEQAQEQYRKSVQIQPNFEPAWYRHWLLHLLGCTQGESVCLVEVEAGRRGLLRAALDLHQHSIAERAAQVLGARVEEHDLLLLDLQQGNLERAHNRANLQPTEIAWLWHWVALQKAGNGQEAMRALSKLSIQNTTYSTIEQLLKGDQPAQIHAGALSVCQKSLLQVGAWSALEQLQTQLPIKLSSRWLPTKWLLHTQSAPPSFLHTILAEGQRRLDLLTCSELMALAVYAHVLQVPQLAHELWRRVSIQDGGRLPATRGMYLLYQALSQLENGGADELRFLALWDV